MFKLISVLCRFSRSSFAFRCSLDLAYFPHTLLTNSVKEIISSHNIQFKL